jgi:hypothetical protein
MNTLLIGGFQMLVGDASAYWNLGGSLPTSASTVRLRECLESGGSYKLSVDDIYWADQIVSYSYGTASIKELWHREAQVMGPKSYAKWFVLAGVPDIWMQQFYGDLWHKPPFVGLACSLQVSDVPVSCTFSNLGPKSFFSFGSRENQILTSSINLACDELFPTFMPPGEKHIQIKENPRILQFLSHQLGVA